MKIAYYKNENVDKAAAAEKMLNEIRTYLSEKAKTGDKEVTELLEKFDAAIKEGKIVGRDDAIYRIRDAINKDPANSIIRLFKDLEPYISYTSLGSYSTYSSFGSVYHEFQQLENKSSLGRSLDRKVELVRDLSLAKDISKQEQTFIDSINQAINNGDIKNVVAWMTMTKLLNEYVLKPAGKEGSVRPDKATKILQNAENALNKLIHPEGQTQVEAQGTPEAQGNKSGATETTGGSTGQSTGQSEKHTETKKQPVLLLDTVLAEDTIQSELVKKELKEWKEMVEYIEGIEEADPKLLKAANAKIAHWNARLQAILNTVGLSKEEREQLEKLQDGLNKEVEKKAKELGVSTRPLTLSPEDVTAAEDYIKRLMESKEKEYEKVTDYVTDYYNKVIRGLAKQFDIPEGEIIHLEEFILAERELEWSSIMSGSGILLPRTLQ